MIHEVTMPDKAGLVRVGRDSLHHPPSYHSWLDVEPGTLFPLDMMVWLTLRKSILDINEKYHLPYHAATTSS
jgi:hypothetical protein